ncbi:ribosome hibernation-promoting factor, HPF/YfiA family [Aquimarina sp. AU474]|uniref:ribosome hibernation-promoting factor, HPF/YfiA family n=1 Tax=Aquimarina sp. AU474 TaxID=2108529 RepID=UPI000D699FB3|nr:ribosome-associated translation inhibitor RaiA [Aquimarina sp. AU474]
MIINIQYVKISPSETLSQYVLDKLGKLGKKNQEIIDSNVFLKRENDPKGKGKICEIKLNLPGSQVFAISNEENFELAVKETLSDIEKQIEKRKKLFKTK